MADDFRSYLKGRKQITDRDIEEMKKQVPQDQFNQLSNASKHYENMSEGQLMQEMMMTARKNKESGSLSNADIDAFVNSVAPMLGAAERQRLLQIAAMLKNQS